MSSAQRIAVPAMAAALYAAFILPPEFTVTVGGLRLTCYRVLLLLVTIPLLVRLFRNNRQPPHLADYLIMAHSAWVIIALAVYGGVGMGIESGGIYLVESLGAYLVGRIAITNADEHRAMLRYMVTLLGFMFLFTLPESITGTHFIRETARAIVGGPGLPVIQPRLGLDRAFGSFDHPILYGVFAATTFAAAYYVLVKEELSPKAIGLMGLVGASCFLSLSAGPFVGLACQAGIVFWDRLTKGISMRWWSLLGFIVMAFFFISLVSNRSPVNVFISYLSFSPTSSYNRILIWEYGSAEVARHPLFGIGFGDWIRAPWMSESMDNFWLLTAVRYGMPALIFLVSAIAVIASRQARVSGRHADLNRHRMAWLAIMAGMAVSGVTVHFWNSMFAYYFFLIGSGAWMLYPRRQHSMRTRSMPSQHPQLNNMTAAVAG